MTITSVVLCVALAATPDPPEVVEVRAVYQRVRGLIDAKKTKAIVVAEGKKAWARITSLEDVPRGDGFIADSARVHVADGKVLAVEYWIQTPSGDWQNRSEHYFREDGTLAFVLEEHLTYQVNSEDGPSPLTVEARQYFDRSGKKFRSTQRTVAADGKVFPDGLAHKQLSAPVFMRVMALPFAKLMR